MFFNAPHKIFKTAATAAFMVALLNFCAAADERAETTSPQPKPGAAAENAGSKAETADKDQSVRMFFELETRAAKKGEPDKNLDALRRTQADTNRILDILGVAHFVLPAGERTLKVEVSGDTDTKEIAALFQSAEPLRFSGVVRLAETPGEKIGPDEEILPMANTSTLFVVKKETLLSADSLETAEMVIYGDEKAISFVFNEDGTKKLFEATKKYAGRQLAIICDSKVVTAPIVSEPIAKGHMLMTVKYNPDFDEYYAAIKARTMPMRVKNISFGKKKRDGN